VRWLRASEARDQRDPELHVERRSMTTGLPLTTTFMLRDASTVPSADVVRSTETCIHDAGERLPSG
jgi:hypothetical protein